MAEVEGSSPSASMTYIPNLKGEKVTEISIRDQIQKLVQLQKIDVDIYGCKRELKEKPAYLEQLKENFERNKASLKALEEKFKKIQVDRKSKELDLQQKEGDIAKANAQLSQIKTNKEYQARITEIEHLKADKSIMEEKILLSFEEADAASAEIEKEKSHLTELEKKYLTQKKEIDDSINEIQDKLKIFEAKRNLIIPDIDKTFLKRYERILENKDGLAMVPVQENSCGGCFMNVPAQVINEIKMRDQFIFCEMCARILYLEDDL